MTCDSFKASFGLLMARKLVERLSGGALIREAEGQGVCISFQVPLEWGGETMDKDFADSDVEVDPCIYRPALLLVDKPTPISQAFAMKSRVRDG